MPDPIVPTRRIAFALAVALSMCSAAVHCATHSNSHSEPHSDLPAPRIGHGTGMGGTASNTAGNTTGGTIEGAIRHPAQVAPPMRICAIGSGAPQQARRICVRTKRGQTRYRISGLPADEYIVIARTEGGDPQYRIGGHMRQVQCIRAPCPAMPAPVTIAGRARATDIDIDQFYDKREDFPAMSPGR